MKTKFTKGEWSLLGYSVMSKESQFDLAKVTVFNEGKANAHLIAAAPEMYSMIESLSFELQCAIDSINNDRMSKVTPQTETPPDLWDQESLHDAQLLLKKARGE